MEELLAYALLLYVKMPDIASKELSYLHASLSHSHAINALNSSSVMVTMEAR
jgi:hypothetical protein